MQPEVKRPPTSPPIELSAAVAGALAEGRAVVALESTVLAQGLPWPTNLEVANELETIIASAGAVPATIAVLDGRAVIGLSARQLETVADPRTAAVKLSTKDLPVALARGLVGATTVAATAFLAARAGITVFATGGIGGVHRGQPLDTSADLIELSRTRLAVVCAGAKSILDLEATREALETLGILVVGWGTDTFPGFFYRETTFPVDVRIDRVAEFKTLWEAHAALQAPGALLVCAPVPANQQIPAEVVEPAIEQACGLPASRHITGKALTPFLLQELTRVTDSRTLTTNIALLKNNAAVATELALGIQASKKGDA